MIRWTYRPPWTPEEAAALDQEIADEERLAYLLRERKPRRRRVDIVRDLPPAVSHVGRRVVAYDGARPPTEPDQPLKEAVSAHGVSVTKQSVGVPHAETGT